MRFLERTIKALNYHRWLYLAGVAVAFCFTLISLCLQTADHLNHTSQADFNQRLSQFDTSALASATRLVAQIRTAFRQVSTHYQQGWWVAVIGLALLACGFALGAAYHRRRETTAYLLVGKTTGDIVAQYLVENAVAFIVGFAAAMVVALALTQFATNQLVQLNYHLLNRSLSDQVSATTYRKITAKLFAHRITDFASNDLIITPHRPQPLSNQMFGAWSTFFAGLATVLGSQVVVVSISVWWQRRRLRHQR